MRRVLITIHLGRFSLTECRSSARCKDVLQRAIHSTRHLRTHRKHCYTCTLSKQGRAMSSMCPPTPQVVKHVLQSNPYRQASKTQQTRTGA